MRSKNCFRNNFATCRNVCDMKLTAKGGHDKTVLSVITVTQTDSGVQGKLGEMTGQCFVMTLQVICLFLSLLFHIMTFISPPPCSGIFVYNPVLLHKMKHSSNTTVGLSTQG